MKIAFVTFGNFDGHATLKRATGMAGPLLVEGHEVFLLLEDCGINREKVELECPGVQVFWHQRSCSARTERRAKQVTLASIQPDVVWICGVGSRNWMRRTHRACIVLADHSELYSRVSHDFVRKAFYWLLEWCYCFSFDGHICASRYLERFYTGRLKKLRKVQNVHYSPYAFHPDVLSPDSEAGAQIQARFAGKKLLLYMGSFWKNYGFWDMLEAFRELASRRDDFIAIMAGRGPEKENGIAWVKEHKLEESIRIEGYVAEEQLSAYFTGAHAFISPLNDTVQDWARCPSKLFMYLPFQHPVVTCQIGEAAELFGEKGLYYQPGDVDSLVCALSRVLTQDVGIDAITLDDHTYTARTKTFLSWLDTRFGRI